MGVSSISNTTNLFVCTSRPTVWSDTNEIPRSAITACLMLSFDDISIDTRGVRFRSLKKRSMMARVPEPSSRTMSSSWLSAMGDMPCRLASGWSGLATKACGCLANASMRVSKSAGVRPMMAMSISPSRSISTI